MDKANTTQINQESSQLGSRYWLAALFLIIFILPINAGYLMVPDETRYAEIPREMLATGDWMVPRLVGLPYFEKPVLGYWVHAIALAVFDQAEWAIRLPSVLCVGISTLIMWWLLHQSHHGPKRRHWADLFALVFLTLLLVVVIAKVVVLDSLFAMLLTATFASFYLATESRKHSKYETFMLISCGFFCGLAFLTKGFLAFALTGMVFGPYLAWMRRWKDCLRMAWLPILTSLLIVLPWAIAIHMKAPDFWRYFFWEEHVHRFMAETAQHREPMVFYLVLLPFMCLPWTFLIPGALMNLKGTFRAASREGRLMIFAMIWFGLPFIFFSISKGKLATYILPCFPALALLVSHGLSLVSKQPSRMFRTGGWLGTMFFLLLAVLLIVSQTLGPQTIHVYEQPGKWIILSGGLLAVSAGFWKVTRLPFSASQMFALGFGTMCLFAVLNQVLPDPTIRSKAPARLFQEIHVEPGATLICDIDTASSIAWHYKRSDIYLLEHKGELDYGLQFQPDRYLNIDDVSALIRERPGTVIIVGRTKHTLVWEESLPAALNKADSGERGYSVLYF